MNKKLLTAAVVAAIGVTSMSASAGVKLFGRAQGEVGSSNVTNEISQTTGVTEIIFIDTSKFTGALFDKGVGRWGIKASEDLGMGMKGLAKIAFDTQDDGGSLTTKKYHREIYAGLKGKFGAITAGSHNGVYKVFGGVKYDPFTATLIEGRNSAAMSGGAYGQNSFIDNSVKYMSPKIGPVQIGFIRGFNYKDSKNNNETPAPAPEDETEGANTDNSHWQLGVKGKVGPVEFVAVHAVRKLAKTKSGSDGAVPGTDGDSTKTKIGGRFSIGKMHKIAVQIEKVTNESLLNTAAFIAAPATIALGFNGGVRDVDATHIYLNWVGKFGKIHPQVGYGIYTATQDFLNGGVGGAGEVETAGAMFQVGVKWKPSKTFSVFAGTRSQAFVSTMTNDAAPNFEAESVITEVNYTIGMRKDF